MTLLAYQDGKLFADVTSYTDYSGNVPTAKWEKFGAYYFLFAGTNEATSAWRNKLMKSDFECDGITECAMVVLKTDGSLYYAENGNLMQGVMILDDHPILFANNALRMVADNYLKTTYSWDKPLLVEMVDKGILPAVVEISPSDNLHYLHRITGSTLLSL